MTMDEMIDREKRKNNLIFYNIPESTSDDYQERQEADTQAVIATSPCVPKHHIKFE